MNSSGTIDLLTVQEFLSSSWKNHHLDLERFACAGHPRSHEAMTHSQALDWQRMAVRMA